MNQSKFIILDRDGVINQDSSAYVKTPDEWVPIERSMEAISLLTKNSYKIITDSGGVQKEAYFFEKNCIILRDETEWVELKKSNAYYLVGDDFNKITDLMNSAHIYYKNKNIFGDGNASKIIVDKIASL